MADDKHHFFPGDDEERNRAHEFLIRMVNARDLEVEATEHMRTLPVKRTDQTGMKLHMINAHQFSLDNVTWADESVHWEVPRIRHKLRMLDLNDKYPKLTHEDIVEWHDYDHSLGEHQSGETDDEHFHY